MSVFKAVLKIKYDGIILADIISIESKFDQPITQFFAVLTQPIRLLDEVLLLESSSRPTECTARLRIEI